MQLLEHFNELSLHPKNAKELKGLILQLAVEGKLTVNWRNENPVIQSGIELLNTLFKNEIFLNKNDSPIHLPESWGLSILDSISEINGGFAFKSSKYVDQGVRVIRISDFDEFGFKNHRVVRYQYDNSLKQYELEKNNIIMAMTGGTVGKSLFITEIVEKMVVNQRVATIKIKEGILSNYINCVLQTSNIQEVIAEAKNSTNDNISMRDIKNFNIPIPPLEEQKAIVEVVNQLFAEVDQLENLTKDRIHLKEDFVTSALKQLSSGDTSTEWLILKEHFSTFFTEKSNIKKLRESILQLAVQGKLTSDWRKLNPDIEDASVLLERIKKEKEQLVKEKKIKKENPLPKISDEEIPYELPEGWVWCRMQSLFKDLRYGTSKKCDYGLGEHPVLRIPNIKNGGIDISDLKTTNLSKNEVKDLSLKVDDLLMIRSNGSENLVGRSSVVSTIGIGSAFAGYLMRLQIFKNDIESKYLQITLDSPMLRKSIEGPLRTTSGVKNINSTEVSSLFIPLAPKEEQKVIVEKVSSLMALCDELEAAIELSKTTQEKWMESSLREVFENERELQN